MQAVILAGGSASRLYAPTAGIPKPMLPIFDRPVVEHCIALLAKHRITDIIVTTSHISQEIVQYLGDGSRFGVRLRYSVETEPLGTAGGLKLVQPMIDQTFVVIPGDAITDADLSAALRSHHTASAMATLMLHEADDPTQSAIVETDSAGKVTRFLEKPRSSEVFSGTISTGICVLEPEVLSCIPYHRPYDFARELVPSMLNNGEPIYGLALPGYWCDAGDMMRYRNAHFDALEGRLSVELPAAHIGQGIWMGERVELHSSVELSSPVFLGAGVVVRKGATIGSRTIIGADTLVEEGAHVSRSVIGGGSLIGRDASVTDCILGSGYSVTEAERISLRTLVEPVYRTARAERLATPAPRSKQAETRVTT